MTTTTAATRLIDNPDFQYAVETARENLPIMRKARRPECLADYIIVEVKIRATADSPTRFAVYAEDAWTKPTERPLLPWSAPAGRRLARVRHDGSITIFESGRCETCNGLLNESFPAERRCSCKAGA